MMDDDLKEKLISKIKGGTFSTDDLNDFIKLEMEICNENEEIQEEVEGFNCTYQFIVEGGSNAWIKIEDGKFSAENGNIEDPDVILTMTSDIAVGIYTGEMDSTNSYVEGRLKITGPLPKAVKFRTITEIIREELDLE